MVKKAKFGVNTYVERSRKKIGRHKKNMRKDEKKITVKIYQNY